MAPGFFSSCRIRNTKYVGYMPSVQHSTIRFFRCYQLPRLALTPARPPSRLKLLGRVERGVKSKVDVVLGPPHLAHFVSSPIPSGSPLRLGRSERPYFRVFSRGSPPEPLFTNHNNNGVVFVVVVVFFTLTDWASTIPSNVRGRQSGTTWSQRGIKVNGSHHGDNPLLGPTGIQIATKIYATLQAMAPTNNKMVHRTSFITPFCE